jgi:hypothetical protein
MVIAGFAVVSTANVLAGSVYEFLARPSRISVGVQSDVAISGGNVFTFQIGDVVIANAAQVFGAVLATAGRQGPVWPDDFLVQNEPGLAGQRLILNIVRGTGNLAWAVIITEVV